MRKTTAALAAATAIVLTPGVAAHAAPAQTGHVAIQAATSSDDSTADDKATNEVKQTANDVEDGFDWGWLGLLGLLGLGGLAGRNRREPVATHTVDRGRRDYTTTTGATTARTDVNRDGRTDVRDVTDRDGDGRIG